MKSGTRKTANRDERKSRRGRKKSGVGSPSISEAWRAPYAAYRAKTIRRFLISTTDPERRRT